MLDYYFVGRSPIERADPAQPFGQSNNDLCYTV